MKKNMEWTKKSKLYMNIREWGLNNILLKKED
jgi:hypothetical protein